MSDKKSLIKIANTLADNIVKKKMAKMEEQRRIEKKDCMVMKKKLDQFKKVETLICKVFEDEKTKSKAEVK